LITFLAVGAVAVWTGRMVDSVVVVLAVAAAWWAVRTRNAVISSTVAPAVC
jgi:hypothetical protein